MRGTMIPVFVLLAAVAAPARAREFTIEVADAPGLAVQLHANIDRATGASTAEFRADVRQAGGASAYTQANYITDLGPVGRALSHDGQSGVEHVAMPIEIDQLQAFVAEGEPWRITLETERGASLPVIIPVAGIAEFLDEIERYQASHPAAATGRDA